MTSHQKRKIAILMQEAELATDARSNGLLDRTDCERIVTGLLKALREVLQEHDDLEQRLAAMEAPATGLSVGPFRSSRASAPRA